MRDSSQSPSRKEKKDKSKKEHKCVLSSPLYRVALPLGFIRAPLLNLTGGRRDKHHKHKHRERDARSRSRSRSPHERRKRSASPPPVAPLPPPAPAADDAGVKAPERKRRRWDAPADPPVVSTAISIQRRGLG
jgi:hypothetical protein